MLSSPQKLEEIEIFACIRIQPICMQTLRGIVFEWRKILKEPIRQTAAFQYLMKQYRKQQVAEREVCENAKQLKSLADTYLIYLQSTRMLKQLEDKYYHKTGITTEEAAAKVGLKLPEKRNISDS
ncbi:UPF0562 protein C29E4.12 [Trichinella sp. T8]|nr:UPF0562 protein C29E4.12 [Trichinella sp. T8]